ncbi:zinc ribbon domain-containing protein [Halopenitus sp. POP-27]|uniref:zinc ribbon domain-containing protein n=1 Tax=Halopenitus sp. POP-27 TaxID=2994425 RepID=UPI002468C2B1|nr:zinc ribbon domain-containing protein [Halopenitus sp. POP-27]
MSKRSDRGSPDRSVRADEVYCTSCGEPIKREAELCPNCGVRNDAAGGGRRGSGGAAGGRPAGGATASAGTAASGTGPATTDGTTVSDTWWYGVAGATALWVLLLIASGAGGNLGAIGGLLLLVAWIGLPVSAYFDIQYVSANSDWDPNAVLWVIGLAIWFVGIVAGVVYLYRRHETLGTP